MDNLHEQMGNFNKKIGYYKQQSLQSRKSKNEENKLLGIENTFSKLISKMDTVEKKNHGTNSEGCIGKFYETFKKEIISILYKNRGGTLRNQLCDQYYTDTTNQTEKKVKQKEMKSETNIPYEHRCKIP